MRVEAILFLNLTNNWSFDVKLRSSRLPYSSSLSWWWLWPALWRSVACPVLLPSLVLTPRLSQTPRLTHIGAGVAGVTTIITTMVSTTGDNQSFPFCLNRLEDDFTSDRKNGNTQSSGISLGKDFFPCRTPLLISRGKRSRCSSRMVFFWKKKEKEKKNN